MSKYRWIAGLLVLAAVLFQFTPAPAWAGTLTGVDLGLTHNLGGHPHQNVCAVAIIGREGA